MQRMRGIFRRAKGKNKVRPVRMILATLVVALGCRVGQAFEYRWIEGLTSIPTINVNCEVIPPTQEVRDARGNIVVAANPGVDCIRHDWWGNRIDLDWLQRDGGLMPELDVPMDEDFTNDMPMLDTTQYKDLLGTFIADLVLQVMSFSAQLERDNTLQRQAEGIAAAKAKGIVFGRRSLELPENFEQVYIRWRNQELSTEQAASLCNFSVRTLYDRTVEWRKEGKST